MYPSLARLLVCGALAALVLASVNGCSSTASGQQTLKGDPPLNGGDLAESSTGPDDGGAFSARQDAGLGGNPLCLVSAASCNPDSARSCASDGGSTSCRIQKGPKADSPPAPVCEAAGAGTDGAACGAGADCAPGFECVGGTVSIGSGPGGAPGICRQYCCAGDCTMARAGNGGGTFCDFAEHLPASFLVPVCVPVKPCELLKGYTCEAGETCTVVSDDGVRSCVAVGKAAAGDSCDQERCQVDLVCRGKPGARRCLHLCKLGGANTCPKGGMCQSFGSKAQDSLVGFCSI